MLEYIEGGPESSTKEFDVKDVSFALRVSVSKFNRIFFSFQLAAKFTTDVRDFVFRTFRNFKFEN